MPRPLAPGRSVAALLFALTAAVPLAGQDKGQAPAPAPLPPGTAEAEAREKALSHAKEQELARLAGAKEEVSKRWFPVIDRTIPVAEGQPQTIGEFEFTNPNDAIVEWTQLLGSCACSHCEIVVGDRRYRSKTKPMELVQLVDGDGGETAVPVTSIPIGPHESGHVAMHVNSATISGQKSVSLDVHMTDPATHMARLHLLVEGKLPVVMQPAFVDLKSVAAGSRRPFQVDISSPVKADFHILSADPFPPGFTATWTQEVVEGRSVWHVVGEFAPPAAKDRDVETNTAMQQLNAKGSTYLRFRTDIPTAQAVNVRVDVKVELPVDVSPTFVGLGAIRADQGARGAVRFTPRDGTDLQVLSVKLEGVSVAPGLVTTEVRKEGDVAIVELVVAPGAPRGLVRGDIIIELNHPDLRQQRVLFNGFVR